MDLDHGAATLLLLNPTGGVLAGDRLEMEISLGPDSAACLSTPSATRVYRSPGPPAVQRTLDSFDFHRPLRPRPRDRRHLAPQDRLLKPQPPILLPGRDQQRSPLAKGVVQHAHRVPQPAADVQIHYSQ